MEAYPFTKGSPKGINGNLFGNPAERVVTAFKVLNQWDETLEIRTFIPKTYGNENKSPQDEGLNDFFKEQITYIRAGYDSTKCEIGLTVKLSHRVRNGFVKGGIRHNEALHETEESRKCVTSGKSQIPERNK